MNWMDEWQPVIRDVVETAILDAHRAAWADGADLGKFVGLVRQPDGTYMAEWTVAR